MRKYWLAIDHNRGHLVLRERIEEPTRTIPWLIKKIVQRARRIQEFGKKVDFRRIRRGERVFALGVASQ